MSATELCGIVVEALVQFAFKAGFLLIGWNCALVPLLDVREATYLQCLAITLGACALRRSPPREDQS